MSAHVHVIPVDPSLTAEEAWHELCLMGVRATDRCDGEECSQIAESSS